MKRVTGKLRPYGVQRIGLVRSSEAAELQGLPSDWVTYPRGPLGGGDVAVGASSLVKGTITVVLLQLPSVTCAYRKPALPMLVAVAGEKGLSTIGEVAPGSVNQFTLNPGLPPVKLFSTAPIFSVALNGAKV